VTGIKTKVPGTHVTNQLPGLAERMDLVAQIRSMTHTQGTMAKATMVKATMVKANITCEWAIGMGKPRRGAPGDR